MLAYIAFYIHDVASRVLPMNLTSTLEGMQISLHILTSCNISHKCHKNNVYCACQFAKSHKLPFNVSVSRASHPLALLHADLWGLASIPSTTGARYFILFVDDFSHFFLDLSVTQQRSSIICIHKVQSLVENQLNS